MESAEMSPDVKNVCREANAADVMGPVDRGDRMIAKNGDNNVGNGTVLISNKVDLSSTPKLPHTRCKAHRRLLAKCF